MASVCPLCRQVLPSTISDEMLKRRSEQLATAALKKQLDLDYQRRLDHEKQNLLAEARRTLKREYAADLKTAKQELEQRARRDRQRLEKESELRRKQDIQEAIRLSSRKERATVEKLEEAQERLETTLRRERVRHQVDTTRLQNQIESMSRSSASLGEDAELDLEGALRSRFREDNVYRLGRHGVKGSDIIHEVMNDGKMVGKIIYESKNHKDWKPAFIQQAKRYQSQYETRFVFVVPKIFPRKERDLCVCSGIVVVSPRVAPILATILRERMVEIARLKVQGESPDEKSKKLYAYIVSDKFNAQFQDVAEGVLQLKEEQRKERDWHEKSWERRGELHEKIEGRHRQIDAQIDTIVKQAAPKKPLQLAARAASR